jgi:hypothetical protein
MRIRQWAIGLVTVLGMVLAASSPAGAAPLHRTIAAAAAAIDWTDLRQDCLNHADQAAQLRGWARSRFEQCHHQALQKINLYKDTGEYLGFIQYEFWLLAKADYSSRRVDMQVSLENVGLSTGLDGDLGYITLDVGNCAGAALITCTGETYRSDNIASWFARGALDPIVATSSDSTGTLPYYTVDLTALTSIQVEYRDGITVPWSSPLATTAARFDSAGSPIGSAPANGAVVSDAVPTMDIDRGATSTYRAEAVHVDDALHHTDRTFPSFVGKNVPGETRPLHRLMGTANEANHTEAVKLCTSIWGPDYASGGLQCDEYPFKATDEGAAYSTSGVTCDNPTPTSTADWHNWNGSARPIDGAQNGNGGSALSSFYRTNRMLDCDAFYVRIVNLP